LVIIGFSSRAVILGLVPRTHELRSLQDEHDAKTCRRRRLWVPGIPLRSRRG